MCMDSLLPEIWLWGAYGHKQGSGKGSNFFSILSDCTQMLGKIGHFVLFWHLYLKKIPHTYILGLETQPICLLHFISSPCPNFFIQIHVSFAQTPSSTQMKLVKYRASSHTKCLISTLFSFPHTSVLFLHSLQDDNQLNNNTFSEKPAYWAV